MKQATKFPNEFVDENGNPRESQQPDGSEVGVAEEVEADDLDFGELDEDEDFPEDEDDDGFADEEEDEDEDE